MSFAHTFWQVRPKPRGDGIAYTSVSVEEGPSVDGPFTPLTSVTTGFPADVTVESQFDDDGWFVLTFHATDSSVERWEPMREDDFKRARPEFFYTTRDDVRLALSPDGDPTDQGSAASLSDDDLDDAVADAQAEVDARVGGNRFSAATVPELVQNLTRDIAAYLATLVQYRGVPLDTNHPVQKRYDRAQGILKDIQAGRIELTGEPDAESEAWVENMIEGDLFSLGELGIGPVGEGARRTPYSWDLDAPLGWPNG